MDDILTKQEEQRIKAVFNNYSMSGSMKKLNFWQAEMVELVRSIVQNHTARKRTKIVEKIVYIDKAVQEQEQADLLTKIINRK